MKHSPEFRTKITRYETGSDDTFMHFTLALDGRVTDTHIHNQDRVYIEDNLFKWQLDDYHSQHFAWYEFDGDDDVPFVLDGTFQTPIGSVTVDSFSVTIHQDDVEMGVAMVDLNDLNSTGEATYSTGAPNFHLSLNY